MPDSSLDLSTMSAADIRAGIALAPEDRDR